MVDNREVIESAVKEEKGLSFTDLKERTGLSNGVLQYHIWDSNNIMKKRGAVLEKYACEDCRFRGRCSDKCVFRELKRPQTRKVYRLRKKGLSQANIAKELDLSRATVHYHVDKLRDLEVLEC